METNQARELVTSSRFARVSIFLLIFFTLIIFYPKTTNAQTYNCSNEQAQAIIDYLKEGHIDPYSGTAGSPSGWEETLDAMNSGELASTINSIFPNSVANTWDNTIIYPIRSTNSSTRYLRLCFLVSTYDPNKIFLSSSYNANGYYQNTIGMSGSGTVYLGRILFSQNGFVSSDFQQYQNVSIQQYRPFETAIIEDRKVINFDYFLTLNSPKSVMIYSSLSGDNGYYQLGDPYYQFNADGSVTKLQNNFEITEGTGPLQYIFDPGNSPDYINPTIPTSTELSSRILVGDELNMFNHYYYYNESGDEVAADDLIYYKTIQIDNQKYIIPYASFTLYKFYKGKTIYQRLSFSYQSGDTLYGKQVLNDFEVIKWTTSTNSIIDGYTGTITNNSGEIIGNISGENNNTNIFNQLTEEPNMEEYTITNEDITNALGIELYESPYTNFWFEMLNGLSNAITGENTTLEMNWLGQNYTLHSSDYHLPLPQELGDFIEFIEKTLLALVMLKWSIETAHEIQSGEIVEVLTKNTDDIEVYF